MCGIAGIITLKEINTSYETSEMMQHLKAMTASLAHRGPDGDGHWINTDTTVGFGHRRLSIIDLSDAGTQPMHYLNRYTIVYNGEIYNYVELKEFLYQNGYRFKTKTDTEVIMAAYDLWKEDCLQKFDGMFSFAIWDEKEKKLFAARDRFGEKPLYYYKDAGQMLFASEMKAFWAVGVPKNVDQKMLLNYLTLGHVQNVIDKEETFYENIYSLPPAHYLELSSSIQQHHLSHKLITKRYWNIDKEKITDISSSDAIEKFSHLFSTSVKRRLRSDVAIGSSLSGGLDSSAIVAAINQVKDFDEEEMYHGTEFNTFSAVFPGYEKNEAVYIQKVVGAFDVKNFQSQPTPEGLINEFEKLCYHQEEPFTSSSVYAQYKVFELAKKHSVKVLLDGQGADETIAGYYKYCHWYLQQILSRGKFMETQRQATALRKNKVPLKWGPRNYLAAYFPPHTALMLENREYKAINNNADINNAFVRSLRGREWEGIRKPVITKLNDVLYFNTVELGLEELLRYADRNSMAHGREVRLPYLSHELVEFIFSLPAHFKIHEGWTKWILRKSVEKILPDEIVWRTDKVGYEPPQHQWMEKGALHDYIHESKKKLVNKGILNKQVLNKAITPKDPHEADNHDWRYLCAAQMMIPAP